MRKRRAIVVFVSGAIVLLLLAGAMPSMIQDSLPRQTAPESGAANSNNTSENNSSTGGEDSAAVPAAGSALEALNQLEVKGRAPKTGYERSQFGNGWAKVNGCNTRDIILYRDLEGPVLDGDCAVVSGTLNDTYSGETIYFSKEKSAEVQIDHVVALSDAWQKGAQQLTIDQRKQLANDPLELIAVSGKENQAKSDSDAASWLPKNKAFRCAYVARQIAVKIKYILWVTDAEKAAITTVLQTCPAQTLP